MSATAVKLLCGSESESLETHTASPEVVFENSLKSILRPGERLLDAGCGIGKFFALGFAQQLCCQTIGVDVEPDLALNRNLDVRVCADLGSLPFSDESFDVVNCRLVVEHLAEPVVAFQEFHRVLRPGGRVAILTPNLLHYFGVIARVTPHWFHVWFNSRVRGFDRRDIFPTRYQANTNHRLRTLLNKAGFRRVDLTMVEGNPDVLTFNPFLHLLGVMYQRLVTGFDLLRRFRTNIVVIAYKG